MSERDLLVSRIFLRSALPLVKVLAEEKPFVKKLFPKFGILQFVARDADVGAHLVFEDGVLDVVQGIHPTPDFTVAFKAVKDMNAFFAGKTVLPMAPALKTLPKAHLLVRVLPLLLGLKLLMPNAIPKDAAKKALKVKLLLYMVTNALSQLNKGGDYDMQKLTKNSPDRIYQWTVEGTDLAAYLRMKGGHTKSGRGQYTRRRPFVHYVFNGIEGAFMVLTSQVPLVEAVKIGHVRTDGPPEFAKDIGLMMQRIEEMTTSY